MASRASITLENLKALGADKLARLVLDETERNAAFKRQVTAALAGLAGPQAVAKIVDRRLAGLERAKSFVDWDKARSFRDDLQSVVDAIESELAKPAPDIAADRLLRFIATHEAIFERVDDSNGSVQDVYYQAIEAVGSVAERLKAEDAMALPERIMAALGETSHGYLVDVTEAVAPHLPKPVLDDWDAELASGIERRDEEERARASDRWHYSMTSQWREMRQIIADARGDLDLLMRLEREIPAGKVVHVILDNYAAHKHAKVRAWLVSHQRWTLHFTPTLSSWLNAVEGFFAKLTRRRMKHGVFRSVAQHNDRPKPFIWRTDPNEIMAARSRGFQSLGSDHYLLDLQSQRLQSLLLRCLRHLLGMVRSVTFCPEAPRISQ